MHKVGLLGLMKNARPAVTKVYLRQHDEHKGLMQFSYFSAKPDIEVVARVNRRGCAASLCEPSAQYVPGP